VCVCVRVSGRVMIEGVVGSFFGAPLIGLISEMNGCVFDVAYSYYLNPQPYPQPQTLNVAYSDYF
jgi:hypothetical protein